MGRLRTICQPPNGGGPPQKGHPCLAASPLAARGELPTPRGTLPPKGWQRERTQRLARICRCIERGHASGKTLHKMVVKHAWRWRGRCYKADPARAIRFTAGTILRIYYKWRDGGRTTAALALRYRCGNQKVSTGLALELSELCLASDTRSFSAAYRKLKAPGATESAYRYAMPAGVRAALAALNAHHRRGQILARVARKAIDRFAAGLPGSSKEESKRGAL